MHSYLVTPNVDLKKLLIKFDTKEVVKEVMSLWDWRKVLLWTES